MTAQPEGVWLAASVIPCFLFFSTDTSHLLMIEHVSEHPLPRACLLHCFKSVPAGCDIPPFL